MHKRRRQAPIPLTLHKFREVHQRAQFVENFTRKIKTTKTEK